MVAKKGGPPVEKKQVLERFFPSCVVAFFAILAAVLKKPQNLGFIFTWKLILGKIGWEKGIKNGRKVGTD